MTGPSHASVRDHVRTVLKKLKNRAERSAEEDKKLQRDHAQNYSQQAAFAERLKAAIDRRGWSLSETARQTASVLGANAKFGRGNLSHYLHGRAMPRARHLAALSHAPTICGQEGPPAESKSYPAQRRAFMRRTKAMAQSS
jgi:NADH:ubiquinone oxidoreductase subunit E